MHNRMRSGLVRKLCWSKVFFKMTKNNFFSPLVYSQKCLQVFDVQPWYEDLWLIWWYVMLILTYHHTMAEERTTTAFSDCVIQHLTSNRDSGFCHFLVLLYLEGPQQDLMSMKRQEGALYMTGMWFCVFVWHQQLEVLIGRQYSSAPKAV